MLPTDLLAALALPPVALRGDAVPKQAILDQLKNAADRRLVRDHLKKFVFHARLTPLTSALPASGGIGALTVALATTTTPPGSAASRALLRLLHRLVPHPLLLLEQQKPADRDEKQLISLTIRGHRCDLPTPHEADLLAALAPPPSGADRDLAALLHRWSLALATADAATLTHAFSWDPTRDPAALAADCAEIRRLDAAIRGLQQKARREKQPGPRAALNAKLREAKREHAATLARFPARPPSGGEPSLPSSGYLAT